MKKFISGLLVGFVIATCGLIYADNVYNTQKASFKVLVNGQEYNNSESPALVVNDRTYLPVKGISEALGVPVAWNQTDNRVEVGRKVEKVVLNKGNTLDTGEGFAIRFVEHKFVGPAETFNIEIVNTSNKPTTYDMSNLKLSGHELKLSGSTITNGSISPGEIIKGNLYFAISVVGDGTWIAKYKDKQTQLNVSILEK